MLELANLLLARPICKSLSDWVVLDFLGLNSLRADLIVRFLHILQALLRFMIALHVLAPSIIIVSDTHLGAGHIGGGHTRHSNFSLIKKIITAINRSHRIQT